MKKIFSPMFLVSMIVYSNNMNAMLNSKITSMASSKISTISTAARRTISSSHPKYKSDNSLKTYALNSAKGAIGGSFGTGMGMLAGGGLAIITTIAIFPTCYLADIEVNVKDIESFTCPAGGVVGGLIGSAAAGGIPGVAGYGALLATSYAIGKYKSEKTSLKENS